MVYKLKCLQKSKPRSSDTDSTSSQLQGGIIDETRQAPLSSKGGALVVGQVRERGPPEAGVWWRSPSGVHRPGAKPRHGAVGAKL